MAATHQATATTARSLTSTSRRMVDVTLVLLIIFMVAAPLIVSVSSIKVNLPKAVDGRDETPRSPLALTLQQRSGGRPRILRQRPARPTRPACGAGRPS